MGGTPKSSILIAFSMKSHPPFWGNFRKFPHIWSLMSLPPSSNAPFLMRVDVASRGDLKMGQKRIPDTLIFLGKISFPDANRGAGVFTYNTGPFFG